MGSWALGDLRRLRRRSCLRACLYRVEVPGITEDCWIGGATVRCPDDLDTSVPTFEEWVEDWKPVIGCADGTEFQLAESPCPLVHRSDLEALEKRIEVLEEWRAPGFHSGEDPAAWWGQDEPFTFEDSDILILDQDPGIALEITCEAEREEICFDFKEAPSYNFCIPYAASPKLVEAMPCRVEEE